MKFDELVDSILEEAKKPKKYKQPRYKSSFKVTKPRKKQTFKSSFRKNYYGH